MHERWWWFAQPNILFWSRLVSQQSWWQMCKFNVIFVVWSLVDYCSCGPATEKLTTPIAMIAMCLIVRFPSFLWMYRISLTPHSQALSRLRNGGRWSLVWLCILCVESVCLSYGVYCRDIGMFAKHNFDTLSLSVSIYLSIYMYVRRKWYESNNLITTQILIHTWELAVLCLFFFFIVLCGALVMHNTLI